MQFLRYAFSEGSNTQIQYLNICDILIQWSLIWYLRFRTRGSYQKPGTTNFKNNNRDRILEMSENKDWTLIFST